MIDEREYIGQRVLRRYELELNFDGESLSLPEKSICNQCCQIDTGCEAWDAEPQTDEDHITWCDAFILCDER